MQAQFKIRSTVDPLLATRIEPRERKSLNFKMIPVIVAFALAAFALGSWWITSILGAF
jgi:hypothetical protein